MGTSLDIDQRLYTAMHKCTRCGQCTYGKEESQFSLLCPMQVKGKFFTYSAGGLMQLARALYEGKVALSGSVRDILYTCTTCGACEVNCGVIESQVDLFTLIKRHLVENQIPLMEAHASIVENSLQKKAPYGGRLPDRREWLSGVKGVETSTEPEVFYYVGCVSSFREAEIAQAFARILNKMGIRFTVSGEEWCCGAPLYFAGHEEDVYDLARHNVEMIEKTGVSRAVFTCPTCSMIFRKYYPRWLRNDIPFQVLHVTEFLDQLKNEGKLRLGEMKPPKKAAYHDPCHLGRGQGIYEQPRRILTEIKGIELLELSLSGENSLCCGGGGLLPAGFPEFSDDLASRRASEVNGSGADILVSSCPACKENLKIAAQRLKIRAKVKDVAEVVNMAMP